LSQPPKWFDDEPQHDPGHPIPLAMAALLKAYRYAQSVHQELWEFAVEVQELRRLGLSRSDLRWLICKGYVEHARETTPLSADVRDFQATGKLNITNRTCFVLTDAGLQFALAQLDAPPPHHESSSLLEEALVAGGKPAAGPHVASQHAASQHAASLKAAGLKAASAAAPRPGSGAPPSTPEPASNGAKDVFLRPHWNSDLRVVTYNNQIVKQFKLPSPNQTAILAAFEEEGWPTRIDDPLPPRSDLDPKQRLHDAIRSINRNQRHRLLCFRGDGTGRGIIWLPADANRPLDDDLLE
jgi:hypothetical protein